MKKLGSVKNLALLFCCAMIVFIVARNMVDWLPIAQVLAYAPLSYFVVNVAQDAVFNIKKGAKNGMD